MSLQEEQWKLVGHCPECGYFLYKKDGEIRSENPESCEGCLIKEEEE